MSVVDKNRSPTLHRLAERKNDACFLPRKSSSSFLRPSAERVNWESFASRRTLFHRPGPDPAQVKEGALQRLADDPAATRERLPRRLRCLKRELEERERVMAEMAVELAVLRKKTNGVSGKDRRRLA